MGNVEMSFFVHDSNLNTWQEITSRDRACFVSRRMSEIEKFFCESCSRESLGKFCAKCGEQTGTGEETIYSAVEGERVGQAHFIERWQLGVRVHGARPTLIIPSRPKPGTRMCCDNEIITPYCPFCGTADPGMN